METNQRDERKHNWWERFVARFDAARSSAEKGDDAGKRAAERQAVVRALIVTGMLGAGFMLLGERAANLPAAVEESAADQVVAAPPSGAAEEYVDALERELAVALAQMTGVGNVSVTIVPRTSEIKVFAQEETRRTSQTETRDSSGRQTNVGAQTDVVRRPVIVDNDRDKLQEPVVEYVKMPELAGVLVVADGADDPGVRYRLLRAVSTLLGVGAHRVEIVARRE